MSFEVEVKFRLDDPRSAEERLRNMGANEGQEIVCTDYYLAHPSRDLAASDEALRLRCEGHENRITYKGPKRGGPTKTREEIEIPFEPGEAAREQMRRLFSRLGFTPVTSVEKTRRSFSAEWNGRAMTVVLDDARDLGRFAEVEAIAEGEAELPAIQRDVLDLAAHLGLTEVEPRSYLRMLLESRQGPQLESP